jgi:hypothetical protein
MVNFPQLSCVELRLSSIQVDFLSFDLSFSGLSTGQFKIVCTHIYIMCGLLPEDDKSLARCHRRKKRDGKRERLNNGEKKESISKGAGET